MPESKPPENHASAPDAFIGSMAAVMPFAEGSAETLSTSVEDAVQAMACVEAAYRSSASGATPLSEMNVSSPARFQGPFS